MDIKENEIDCLKILKYKLNHYSLYDILRAYRYNGFILFLKKKSTLLLLFTKLNLRIIMQKNYL